MTRYLAPLLVTVATVCGLTACGDSGTTTTTPQKPVETHTPSFYDPTGTWVAVMHNKSSVLDMTYTFKFDVTRENVYDSNNFYSYRYYDTNNKPIETKYTIFYGNTKDGEVTIVDRIGGGTCKGSFDTAKNSFYGTCDGNANTGHFLVMQRQ